jgi:hypothetical protein
MAELFSLMLAPAVRHNVAVSAATHIQAFRVIAGAPPGKWTGRGEEGEAARKINQMKPSFSRNINDLQLWVSQTGPVDGLSRYQRR